MAQRIDSALVKAGAAASLAKARALIREGRVLICKNRKAVWKQIGRTMVGGSFATECQRAVHPHQNAEHHAWVGNRQVFFSSKPLAASKRRKRRFLGIRRYLK